MLDACCQQFPQTRAYLLESPFTDKPLVVVLGSRGPSDIVSIIVRLSDLLLLFVPDLHTVVKDENVDGTSLTFIPGVSAIRREGLTW
jgi:hypothetical protein